MCGNRFLQLSGLRASTVLLLLLVLVARWAASTNAITTTTTQSSSSLDQANHNTSGSHPQDRAVDLSQTPRLKDVLNVFDLQRLAANWDAASGKLGDTNCSRDLRGYFEGLRQGALWAAKMDDASGHYTSGFYYGNNYWMGSLSLCRAILQSARADDSEVGADEERDNAGLPFAKVHSQTYHRVYNEKPPFVPGFYVLKFLLNETYPTPVNRVIFTGHCLPASCSTQEVRLLAEYAHTSLPGRGIELQDVRMPGDPELSILKDHTFWVLLITTAVVFVLMAIGTIFEMRLRHRLQAVLRQQDKELMNNSETSSGIGCASSDYSGDSITVTDESVMKKDLAAMVVLNLGADKNQRRAGNVSARNGGSHSARSTRSNSSLSSGNSCDNDDDEDDVDEEQANIKQTSGRKQLANSHNTSNGNKMEHFQRHLVAKEPENLSLFEELLLSFSVITNFRAICDRNVGADTLSSIHGLRAFSMAWVILGHTCIVVFKYSDNMEMRKEVEQNFFFQAVTNGAFSVDTFFFISGCLVSYLYFRTNAKGSLNKLSKNGNELTRCTTHFGGLVIYRFMRLTAPYMFVLGIGQVTMKYLAANSIFEPPTTDHITCPQYWWRNLLYINTLFPVEQMCMLWSWYLANDTQFYMIGAIILIIGVRHFKVSACTMSTLLIVSWVTTAVIAFNNNHRPDSDDPLALFDKIYDKPWTRLGPYLIGMAVGWILFRSNCKIRFNKTSVLLGWLLAICNLLLLVFGLYHAHLSQLTAALYSSLSHSAWAMSLAWITIACSTGHGGPVNSLLSAPCLYPFSRVTYCAYLVHPIVIRAMALNTDAPLHLGSDTMVIMFCGLVVASYLLSFVVSLSFEAPVVTMLKIMSPSRKRRVA